MKLGIAYNVFDGTELLKQSIEQVRGLADFIVVVGQERSNFGERIPKWTKDYLMDALTLADASMDFEPDDAGGHRNELRKRNMGLERCKRAGCTHFMTMDADEFYDAGELRRAMDKFESGDYDASACMMQTYYGLPTHALDPPESYYVPLIYKIDMRSFMMGQPFPVIADPTRKMRTEKFLAFGRDEIEMHHFSYLRKDIRLKLRNSSARTNFNDRVVELAAYYDNWESGKQASLAGREERYYDLKIVENKFNIEWQK